MKRFSGTCIIALGQLVSHGAGIGLQYPVGGEVLPINGKHVITWTNSANLPVSLYIDWYETNGNPIVTNQSLYSLTLPAGTNTYVFFPSNYTDGYRYKVRVEGDNSGTIISSSSGFVDITGLASFSGQVNDTNAFMPGTSKGITVAWAGFQSNDLYKVILESPILNKAGYGFLVTNVLIGSVSGTQTLTIPFPTNPVAAYPPDSYSLLDGGHVFTLVNKRCSIVQTFGTVDVVTAGLRMYLTPGVTTNVTRGESIMCSRIMLDALLATNDVKVTNITLVLTSYSTNWLYMFCNLMDTNRTVSMDIVNFIPQAGSNYNTQVSFPLFLNIKKGQAKELDLMCFVQGKTETGTFIWNTDVSLGGQVGASYTNGIPITVSVIPSSSSYVNIQEIINSVFTSSGTSTNLAGSPGGYVSFDVMVKAQTSYSILTSTNLVNWDTLLTTNSTSAGLLSLVATNLGGAHFFKMKEN